MGRHTKHGGYIIDWDKVRTYVVPPNLKEFRVSLSWLGRLVQKMANNTIADAICDEKYKTC